MRLRLVCIAASILAGATLPVSAQQPEVARAPDRGAHARVPGIIVSPVPNLPFSGRDNIEWTRKLDDGSSLTQHLDAVVARDSQGRIYRETHSFVAAGSNQKSPLREFIIYDREARTRTACNVSSRRCEVSLYNPATNRAEPPVGPSPDGKSVLARESLGNSVVENLSVVGTRETLTTAAGAVGNTQPLVSTREFWYSPELQINVSVTRQSPTEGTQAIQLLEVSRSDPDPALFQIPAEYQIHAHRSTPDPSIGGR
jgi:hypothetical protein